MPYQSLGQSMKAEKGANNSWNFEKFCLGNVERSGNCFENSNWKPVFNMVSILDLDKRFLSSATDFRYQGFLIFEICRLKQTLLPLIIARVRSLPPGTSCFVFWDCVFYRRGHKSPVCGRLKPPKRLIGEKLSLYTIFALIASGIGCSLFTCVCIFTASLNC